MNNLPKNPNGFSVSENAAQKFREIIDSLEVRPAGVRVYNSEACCGSSVQMELAAGIQPGEVQLEMQGVMFFVNSDFLKQLRLVTIDFSDDGFRLLGYQRSEGCCGR